MPFQIHIPYILLIIANFIYLYAYGFKPIVYHPRLILYNFILFLIVGIVVFFKVSYHLYYWFRKNQGDTKQKSKQKLKQLLTFVNMVLNYLRPGNERNLIKLYSFLALWTFLSYLVPSFLLGIFFWLIYEIKEVINLHFSEELSKIQRNFDIIIIIIQQLLPRYEGKSQKKIQKTYV